ncbi:polynucleotide kinase 3 phosphatase-domain-containing protein [Cokeromyces recurvatus]|uniref:polynucleotide kinase 3 phosphatase-domain-containing protein n=1 Tax=Cokeromyces recurvatus TaxID=90255 RepID=UPI002220F74B|nr:polynucleotide kinase 3 phosphatase-domain-containing protein [Cokeromyces recurvatus]KAI7902980.1 polynucleotide kinase 3 phosphatase-domain-containing protein [Cokeromyces recurvatus]
MNSTKKAKGSVIQWIKTLDSVLIAKSRMLNNDVKTEKCKIAAFDLDGTLIKTKGKHVHSKDKHDWLWWDSMIPKRLEKLNNEGYQIVILSNQNGLRKFNMINDFKYKMENILSQVNSPILFMAALEKDMYRKPMTGMWDWLNTHIYTNIDKMQSLYVGDAAGREVDWKPNKKKDHSCGDRKFAANLQINFYTPEEFFLNEPKTTHFSWKGFDANQYLSLELPLYTPQDTPLFNREQKREVIICVGYPASGKSRFVEKYLVKERGYIHINQDTLKTKDKCIKRCKEALENSTSSIVIDNTNPERSTRAIYIKLAQEAKAPVRCFYFGDNMDLAQHNNYYRALYQQQDPKRLLSSIVFHKFKKSFQPPTLSEGFEEIKQIHFVFDESEKEKEIWKKWWTA